MAEEKKTKSFEELIKQVEDFEKTIQSLGENVSKLKAKLADRKVLLSSEVNAAEFK